MKNSNLALTAALLLTAPLLGGCKQQQDAANLTPIILSVAASLNDYSSAYFMPPKAGPVSTALLRLAVADFRSIALDEGSPTRLHEPPEPHLRTTSGAAVVVSFEGGGVVAFQINMVSQDTCAALGSTKPPAQSDLIFNKNGNPYVLSTMPTCSGPNPTVTMRVCAPRMGSCPAPESTTKPN